MKFSFIFKGKREILNVKECKNIFSRGRGLMFRKNSKPLLFIFKKPVRLSIHSFFCLPFIAIWFYNDKVADMKFVKPWKFIVKSKTTYDRLLEIPINDRNFLHFSTGKIYRR